MKKIKYILSSTILALFLVGCDVQEQSQDTAPIIGTDGYPTASFTLSGSALTTNEEDQAVYIYDVVLDKPLKYNIDFNVEQTGGTASEEDYAVAKATVNAFETTGQMMITILNNDEIEDIETLQLTIVPGPSVADRYLLRPETPYPTLDITIEPYTSGDLVLGMEWAADNGSGDDPRDLADLILLVTDAVSPYTEVIGGADGGDFETFTMTSDTPDGDYFIVADVFALDDSDFDMDISVTFDQAGVINGGLIELPAAMNSRIICSDYVVLAKVTKSGENYTVTSENATLTNDGTPDTSSAAPYIGTATVVADDWADYSPGETIEIEAGASANEFWIRSTANPFISNPDTSYMIVTLDPCGGATVMSNEDFEYGCSEGDVTGTGTVDPDTMTVDLTLTFGLGDCGDFTGNHFVLQL